MKKRTIIRPSEMRSTIAPNAGKHKHVTGTPGWARITVDHQSMDGGANADLTLTAQGQLWLVLNDSGSSLGQQSVHVADLDLDSGAWTRLVAQTLVPNHAGV